MKKLSNKTCWVVTEGIAGTENQCVGVAETLGIHPIIKRVKLRSPWKELTPYFRFFNQYAFSKDSDKISPPWPDITICSGRKSIPAALYIKQASKGKTLIVQIQDPRCNPALFDLVFVPTHDPTRGQNVHTILGGLNRITDEKLNTENNKFPAFFKNKKEKIAILIGGKSKAHHFTDESIKKLCDQLKALSNNYNLMITASRRTGEEYISYLKNELSANQSVYFYDGNGENPYFAFLARADYILCTEDSVSMISEALTSGKPTYIIKMLGGGKRIDKFHADIINNGYAQIFTGEIDPSFDSKTLNETNRVAEIIKKYIENK